MRIISVMNYKGGTGKTSTVVNTAHGLALKGHKVLIIDADPQGSAGIHLGINSHKTLYNLIIEGQSPKDCIQRAREDLDIICANEHLYPAEIQMAKMSEKESLLKNRLKSLSGYDYVLIDCAPSINILNQNVLTYADEIILPVSMEYLALVGVKQLLKNIKIINRITNRNIQITKVIPTFFDRRKKKSDDILKSLRRVFPNNMSTEIHSSLALSEAPGFKQSIFEYDPKSKGAEDYGKLVKEVLDFG